jgi:DNA-binding transcriptional MerR regulator
MTNPLRRLSDALANIDLLEIQLHAIARDGGAHHIRDVGLRISAIHQRLDELEARLRSRAVEMSPGLATLRMSEVRRRLRQMRDRRRDVRPVMRERRSAARRRSDLPVPASAR